MLTGLRHLGGRAGRLLSAFFLAGVLAPSPLFASYVDPLTGSIVLQVLAAGALSFLFTMKRSWRWLGQRWSALRQGLRRR